MTIYGVTRHAGAIDWLAGQGYPVDHWVTHLEPLSIQPGDIVIGTLPIHLAAQVCARAGRYLHLSLDVPLALRGQELSAPDLDQYGARLEEYLVISVAPQPPLNHPGSGGGAPT